MQFAFRRVYLNPPAPGSTPPLPRPRPVVPLRVHGRGRSLQSFVLVDTGADEILLPAWQMAPLGFSPAQAQVRSVTGVGARSRVWFFPVELELQTGPTDRVRWRTTVGFGAVPAQLGLFGVAGGLEFFHTTVSVVDGWFSLAPHPLLNPVPPTVYPHTPYRIP